MMQITIWQSVKGEGIREVTVRAGGAYGPDILNDLKNRATEAFNELFVAGEYTEATLDLDEGK